MDSRTVYPGRVWPVEYNGPQTKWPTYLVAAIYEVRESVDKALWTIMFAGRWAEMARDGDFKAAGRAAYQGEGAGRPVAVALVSIDTTASGAAYGFDKPGHVDASILYADGDWMLWHEAQRWELKGVGNLMDAVQTAVNHIAEKRNTPDPDPFDPPAASTHPTRAERMRSDAEKSQDVATATGTTADPVTLNAWTCDECKSENPATVAVCSTCGLTRGEKPTTNLTASPPVGEYSGPVEPLWQCKACDGWNHSSLYKCAACSLKKGFNRNNA